MAFIDNIDFIPNSKNPKFGLLSVLKGDDLTLEYLTEILSTFHLCAAI